MSTSMLRQKPVLVLIGWTVLAAVIAYPIYLHNRSVCNSSLLGQEGCAATGVGSFWHPFVPVWLIGLVILAISWPVIRQRRRLCPVCGGDVKRGLTACPSCGHDFAAAAGAPRTAATSD
jgi:rubredoxin